MRLIYIDESGLPDDPNQPLYYLTAVVVDERSWHSFDFALRTVIEQCRYRVLADVLNAISNDEDLWRKWSRKVLGGRELPFPTRQRTFSRWDRDEFSDALRNHFENRFELHAEPLWNRRDVYLGMRRETRAEVLTQAFDVLDAHAPEVLVVGLEKSEMFLRGYNHSTVGAAAFSLLVERLDALLQGKGPNEFGMLIADSGGPEGGQIRRLLRVFQQHGTHLINKKIERVVDNLHFVESVASPPIQVADLLGYFLRREALRCQKTCTWQTRSRALVTQLFKLP